jgi:hypothetical protein
MVDSDSIFLEVINFSKLGTNVGKLEYSDGQTEIIYLTVEPRNKVSSIQAS